MERWCAGLGRNLYEIAALAGRYVFAGLMLLIVLRAWRITIVDSRRAGTLRRMSPETGISGELVVVSGDEKARRGMKYPVIREGMIGSSRRADIRIRHSSVRRRHAYFQLTEDGLKLRTHAGAPLRDDRGHPVRQITLPDGAEFSVGKVRLLLVLSEAPEPAQRQARRRPDRRGSQRGEADDLFDTGRTPREGPARRKPERRLGRPIDVDEYFDTDDGEQW